MEYREIRIKKVKILPFLWFFKPTKQKIVIFLILSVAIVPYALGTFSNILIQSNFFPPSAGLPIGTFFFLLMPYTLGVLYPVLFFFPYQTSESILPMLAVSVVYLFFLSCLIAFFIEKLGKQKVSKKFVVLSIIFWFLLMYSSFFGGTYYFPLLIIVVFWVIISFFLYFSKQKVSFLLLTLLTLYFGFVSWNTAVGFVKDGYCFAVNDSAQKEAQLQGKQVELTEDNQMPKPLVDCYRDFELIKVLRDQASQRF